MTAPRVLHVLLGIGETTLAWNELCLARAEQHAVGVCTYLPPGLVAPPSIPVFGGDGRASGFCRALAAAVARDEWDVVHVHNPHVAVLLLAARLRWPGRLRRPAVYTVHSSFPNFRPHHRLMMLPVFATFDRIVCVSHASQRSLPLLYRRLAGARLAVVQNGVNLERVDRVSVTPRPADAPFRAVTVGRLIALKNPRTLLEAFRRADDGRSELCFVGDGALRRALRDDAVASGLGDRVTFTGLVARDDVYRQLGTADLFVSASRIEGLPVAPLEAMACRTPVVLSDIPPHREIVGGTTDVPLVPPDDVDGFGDAIARVRGLPPAARRALGARGRRLVEREFSLAGAVQRYDEVYAEAAHHAHRDLRLYRGRQV